jgi:phage virion morphogenesis protein
MPSADITLSAQDIAALKAKLNNFKHTRPLMARIGRAIHTDTMLNFKRGVSPDGVPWLPIKHRTGQPLRDTGRLQRSITWENTDTVARIGTHVIYAAAHNFGIEGKLPQRQFIGIGKKQVDIINRIADKWLQERLEHAQS